MSPPTFCVTLTPSFAKPSRTIVERAVDVEVGRGRREDLVLHRMRRLRVRAGRRRHDPDAVRAPLVPEPVERRVGRGAVVRERAEVRVLELAGDVADDALDLGRVAGEDDVDDLVAVDAHRERLLHRRVEQLAVLRLGRVRVPGDVGRLGAGNRRHHGVRRLLHRVDGLERHLVGPVDVAAPSGRR